MATLAAPSPRVFETGHDEMINEVPIIANDIVYEGAAVGESSSAGTGRPLVGGDNFIGFATETVDNSGGLAGAKRIPVKQRGVVKLSVAGVTGPEDYGADVYATDDDTFTLTGGGGTRIGKVMRHVSGTVCLVAFLATALRITEVVSGGEGSGG